jgi:hypothetical protein
LQWLWTIGMNTHIKTERMKSNWEGKYGREREDFYCAHYGKKSLQYIAYIVVNLAH